MSKSRKKEHGDQFPEDRVENARADGERLGVRESESDEHQSSDSSQGYRRSALGRSLDFSQVKKTRSIGMTDDHYELWRKAAHPKSRSHWLAEHLEEHKERIEQSYKEIE